jgi:hypothetical protein
MYSDLFEHLQGGRSSSRSGAASAATTVQEPEPLVQLKAGKMILEPSSSSPSTASSSFHCVPDTTRGEIRLVWKNGHLKFQWYDRKRKTVVDDHVISAVTATAPASSFQRVPLAAKIHAQDRIYVWTDCSISMNPPNYRMYWMQDQDDANEAEAIEKINQYLKDPQSAAPPSITTDNVTAGTATHAGTLFANAASSTATTATAGSTAAAAAAASSSSDNHQVDALSSILENLGMPQGDSSAASASSENATAPGAAAAGQRQLTLADLNLAMAELNNHHPNSSATTTASSSRGPPLHEIVTHEAIDRILQDPDVRQRLMEFLPEEQRGDEAALAENLKSPQIQSTLRTLTQTLLPDDALDLSGYASLIANFQLDPQDGQDILMRQGDPIAAFLECVVKSAEREQQQQPSTKGEDKEKETKEKQDEE